MIFSGDTIPIYNLILFRIFLLMWVLRNFALCMLHVTRLVEREGHSQRWQKFPLDTPISVADRIRFKVHGNFSVDFKFCSVCLILCVATVAGPGIGPGGGRIGLHMKTQRALSIPIALGQATVYSHWTTSRILYGQGKNLSGRLRRASSNSWSPNSGIRIISMNFQI